MLVRLKTHVAINVSTMIFTFFAGWTLLTFLKDAFGIRFGALDAPLSFVLVAAVLYLPWLAFSQWLPAECPKCGGRAFPVPENPTRYACRDCGAQSNAVTATVIASAPEKAVAAGLDDGTPDLSWRWLLLVLGTGCLGAALFFGAGPVRLLMNGATADARVVRVKAHPNVRGTEYTYTASIVYRVGKYEHAIDRSTGGSKCFWPCYRQGQTLKVRYLPGEPRTAEVDSLPALLLVPALLGAGGFLLALIGGVALAMARRSRSV